jgi:hypothetical protein
LIHVKAQARELTFHWCGFVRLTYEKITPKSVPENGRRGNDLCNERSAAVRPNFRGCFSGAVRGETPALARL